ncbi:MAG: hypothetical protein EZS28_002353 [Streblomastix strix]|uniref:Uncharacterized protein n=1 Tax=Streblomastix strix TaxID=222440 RepID=A0A5J4X558_9EUKA|nr:MAG: hypothetical protein EZS28_002353 [Streblomastix strix]
MKACLLESELVSKKGINQKQKVQMEKGDLQEEEEGWGSQESGDNSDDDEMEERSSFFSFMYIFDLYC